MTAVNEKGTAQRIDRLASYTGMTESVAKLIDLLLSRLRTDAKAE